jgi:chemotaxis protein methyltransferase CheR
MTPEDALLVSQLSAARGGLKVDPDKAYLIESRLAPVARREGFETIEDMLAALKAQREERLIWAVVEAMSMGETSFFRDAEVFRRLREELLPAAILRSDGAPVRIWSAACGSGQEVYSLAMIVDELLSRVPAARVELYASDLNERALEKAQSGQYTQFEVQRGLPIREVVRHFERDGDTWGLSPRIRQMVRWRRINLIGDLSAVGRFDIILCRYVMRSLLPEKRARVLESLALALSPQGRLILGEGENASAVTPALTALDGAGTVCGRNPAFRIAA